MMFPTIFKTLELTLTQFEIAAGVDLESLRSTTAGAVVNPPSKSIVHHLPCYSGFRKPIGFGIAYAIGTFPCSCIGYVYIERTHVLRYCCRYIHCAPLSLYTLSPI